MIAICSRYRSIRIRVFYLLGGFGLPYDCCHRAKWGKTVEWISWETPTDELLVIFFVISLIFPKGNLGVGPRSPFLLSFWYAKAGKIQQENTALNKSKTKTTNIMLRIGDKRGHSISLSKNQLCLWPRLINREIRWVFIKRCRRCSRFKNGCFWPWQLASTYFQISLNIFNSIIINVYI